MMKNFIAHKKGSFGKTIFKITNKNDISYIVKISIIPLNHEVKMYNKLIDLMISNFFAQIYKYDKKGNKYICFSKYINDDIHSFYKKISTKKRFIFWNRLFKQLIYVVSILEKYKIQHNDFHLGNLMISGSNENDFTIKIIDLETMCDYKNKIIPKEIINATKYEKYRLGWNKKFHTGTDLN